LKKMPAMEGGRGAISGRPGPIICATGRLRRAFAIGFLILFGFIGIFTYIGFVLRRAAAGAVDDGLGLRLLSSSCRR